MIAFSLMTLFIVSAVTLSTTSKRLREQAVERLKRLEVVTAEISTFVPTTTRPYGNDTKEVTVDPFTILYSTYQSGWGRDSCNPRIDFDPDKMVLFSQGVDLGVGNTSTDIEVRNGIAYLTADGSSASSPDLYIINVRNPASPYVMSSLNTGPGISALEIAGHYIYTANLSTTNQLQVIDIRDRSAPVLETKFKLPLPTASTTAPLASAIFYSHGLIYLGTQKWGGSEFSVIDVTVPSSPVYLGGFEIGTLVNDIYVRDGIAYVAASDLGQMRILDVHHPNAIVEIGQFSPSGWATQQGRRVSYFEYVLSLGRTTGGFNVIANPEIFTFSTSTQTTALNFHDIPGGVYGILFRPPYIYLATKSVDHEFQVWKSDLSQMVSEKTLGFSPLTMTCDASTVYFATGNQRGFAVLKIK